MTKLSTLVALALFASTPALAQPTARPAATTFAEIEKTIGFVPAFVKVIPEALVAGWWEQVGALEMNPKTALDNRTKELIGLAVAAQIPCDYCVYFHAKVAKLNGATDQQIQEAVGMAAMTRFSSTLMNGLQVDLAGYKKDVDRAFKPRK